MKRPIKVYLSAHSEDVASASRVASLVLGELGCEVIADYTPVEKTKQCRANRRRSLQRCNVFLQLVGRDAGPILSPEHQHDSLCSVAVWEAGEASALQKPVVRMLLAEDFPFDDSESGQDDEEITRFQTVHRHRLMNHQRKVLPVEDYEDLVQRIGRMWGGSFARQHSLPDIGIEPESIDGICQRVSARLFDTAPTVTSPSAKPTEPPDDLPPVAHQDGETSLPGARALPVNRAPIAPTGPSVTQIVVRPVGSIVPRSAASEGNPMASNAPDRGNGEVPRSVSAPAVAAMPLQRAEDTKQCSPDDSLRLRAETEEADDDSPRAEHRSLPEELPPIRVADPVVATEHPATAFCLPSAAKAISSDLSQSTTKNFVAETVLAPASANRIGEVSLATVEQNSPNRSTPGALPGSALANPTARIPILGLSAPAMAIAASRHALFLSLLNRSATGAQAADVPVSEPVTRLGGGSESVPQAPMKLEISRPRLHEPPPVRGSSPQQWRVPFRRSLSPNRGKPVSHGAQTASGCFSETDPLTRPLGSIVSTLKYPGVCLRNGSVDEVSEAQDDDVSIGHRRSLYSKQIRITLTVVGGLFAWALVLMLYGGWQYLTKPRTVAEPTSQVTTGLPQKRSEVSPSTDDTSTKQAAHQSISVSSSASDEQPALASGTFPPKISAPESTPAGVSVQSYVSKPLTLAEEQDLLECQLEAAIVKIRADFRDAKVNAGAHEKLLQDLLLQFQELAPKIANRGSPRSPEALAMSRHLASIHLLCGHPQSARNVLMDMREVIAKPHSTSDAQVRLTDYLLELTDNYTPSSLQSSAIPQFPMTPGETQRLLDLLRSRPEWVPAGAGAAIAGSNSTAK